MQSRPIASSNNQKQSKRKRSRNKSTLKKLSSMEDGLKKDRKEKVKVQSPSVKGKKRKGRPKTKVDYRPFTTFKETKGEEGNFKKLIYNQPKY